MTSLQTICLWTWLWFQLGINVYQRESNYLSKISYFWFSETLSYRLNAAFKSHKSESDCCTSVWKHTTWVLSLNTSSGLFAFKHLLELFAKASSILQLRAHLCVCVCADGLNIKCLVRVHGSQSSSLMRDFSFFFIFLIICMQKQGWMCGCGCEGGVIP